MDATPPEPEVPASASRTAPETHETLTAELAYAGPVQQKPSMITAIGVLDLIGVAVGLLATASLGFMIAGMGFAFATAGAMGQPLPAGNVNAPQAAMASADEIKLVVKSMDTRLALTPAEKTQLTTAFERGRFPFEWNVDDGLTTEDVDTNLLGTSAGETGGAPTKSYNFTYGNVDFVNGGVQVISYAGTGYSDVTVNADGSVDLDNFGTPTVVTPNAAANAVPSYLAPAVVLGTGLALNLGLLILLGIVGIGMLRGAPWAQKYQRVWAYAKLASALLVSLGIGWLFYRFFQSIGGPAVGMGFVGVFYGIVFLVAGVTYPVGVLLALRGWDVRQYFSTPAVLR